MRSMGRPTLLLVCMLTAGMVAAPSADARKPEKPKRVVRHVEARYDSPAVGAQGQGGGVCVDQTGSDPVEGLGCVAFMARPTEYFIEVQVVDTLGLPVPAWVQTETDHVRVCGGTAKPIRVEPGTENVVWVFAAWSGIGPPCPGTATRGVIRASFSNRR
ncbi:MAG: hypothetical protein M3280_00075 [Actinomycetota bacterium]|nr:hypothetical protein [Actinomycetota bacterium]